MSVLVHHFQDVKKAIYSTVLCMLSYCFLFSARRTFRQVDKVCVWAEKEAGADHNVSTVLQGSVARLTLCVEITFFLLISYSLMFRDDLLHWPLFLSSFLFQWHVRESKSFSLITTLLFRQFLSQCYKQRGLTDVSCPWESRIAANINTLM